MKILITGGAGFIGSAVCRHLVLAKGDKVVNIDKLTYAGNLQSLAALDGNSGYVFYQADICDEERMFEIMVSEGVDAVMHLAAESHVDRSIDGPEVFIQTNVVGTLRLLNAALRYWRGLDVSRKQTFRFHHVSTDEVFGDLPFNGGLFTENSPYEPSSPYSASKASSDHLVRAWNRTFGLPVVLSNCSNNYGPFHFPEKLIPLAILNALEEKQIPIYGKGTNVRDWLFVDDHARALELVVKNGNAGESYNIGGNAERTNLSVVEAICSIMDEKRPRTLGRSYKDLVSFVSDRPGHDRRYAIDATKAEQTLGWKPSEDFNSGLAKTIDWYLANEWWWAPLRSQNYRGDRLGRLAPAL